MNAFRKFITLSLVLAGLLVLPSRALEYSFSGASQATFYQNTSYASIYGAEYQYGGTNVIDMQPTQLAYGTRSTTYTGVMDNLLSGGLVSMGAVATSSTLAYTNYTDYNTAFYYSTTYHSANDNAATLQQVAQYTEADQILQSNGTLGTISIPSLGITATVKPDETMSYSVGHISSTSAWNSNVGICGHNRGASVVIGDIKDLEIGDIITYQTSLGTRTYAVAVVTQISSTDWSYLTATTDNRITLITCVENESDLRWCVQAIAIS